MAEPARKRLSYTEYLDLETRTDLRHEFLDGEAWAMAGGTPRHSRVKVNLITRLNLGLGAGPCRLFDSDLKIRVLESGLATYPDAAVICGPVSRDPQDRNALTNPVLLVEVLSESTEAWDRGAKFAHYRRIPELRHYLLVDAGQARVEHFARQPDGRWLLSEYGAGQTVGLPELGLLLEVDALYQGMPEEDEEDVEGPEAG